MGLTPLMPLTALLLFQTPLNFIWKLQNQPLNVQVVRLCIGAVLVTKPARTRTQFVHESVPRDVGAQRRKCGVMNWEGVFALESASVCKVVGALHLWCDASLC